MYGSTIRHSLLTMLLLQGMALPTASAGGDPIFRGQCNNGSDSMEWFVDLPGERCFWFVGVGSDEVEELTLYLWKVNNNQAVKKKGQRVVMERYCPAYDGSYRTQLKLADGKGVFALGVFREKPADPYALLESAPKRSVGPAPVVPAPASEPAPQPVAVQQEVKKPRTFSRAPLRITTEAGFGLLGFLVGGIIPISLDGKVSGRTNSLLMTLLGTATVSGSVYLGGRLWRGQGSYWWTLAGTGIVNATIGGLLLITDGGLNAGVAVAWALLSLGGGTVAYELSHHRARKTAPADDATGKTVSFGFTPLRRGGGVFSVVGSW